MTKMAMIQKTNALRWSRLPRSLLSAVLVIFFFCAGGCLNGGEAGDITNLKITDFSQLNTPGDFSGVFLVNSYDVPIEKFALIRIFAESMDTLIRGSSDIENFSNDGLYCGRSSPEDYARFEKCLEESSAKRHRSISMLIYEQSGDQFWFKPAAEGMVIYKDRRTMPRSIDLSQGRLGFMLSVAPETDPLATLIVAPIFQKRQGIADTNLHQNEALVHRGRTVIESLSVSTMIRVGDFVLFCPDVLPLDNITFSKYAFEAQDDTKFRIYSIFCRKITTSAGGLDG
jgi:hypothetical protein